MPEVSKKGKIAAAREAKEEMKELPHWKECLFKAARILESLQGPAAKAKWNPHEQYALSTQAMAYAIVGQVLFEAEGAPETSGQGTEPPKKRSPGRPRKSASEKDVAKEGTVTN